jgi:hypothetical protein
LRIEPPTTALFLFAKITTPIVENDAIRKE